MSSTASGRRVARHAGTLRSPRSCRRATRPGATCAGTRWAARADRNSTRRTAAPARRPLVRRRAAPPTCADTDRAHRRPVQLPPLRRTPRGPWSAVRAGRRALRRAARAGRCRTRPTRSAAAGPRPDRVRARHLDQPHVVRRKAAPGAHGLWQHLCAHVTYGLCWRIGVTLAQTFFSATSMGSWPATTRPSSSVQTVSASLALPKFTGGAFE